MLSSINTFIISKKNAKNDRYANIKLMPLMSF